MDRLPSPRTPSFEECRRSAAAVRRAPLGRETLDIVRPRGLSGLFRSRAPLSLQLWLAGREGWLLWWSTETFVLLEPPGNDPPSGSPRWLRWLDRWWDPLLFAVPALVLLALATALGMPSGVARWRLVAAVVCGILVLVYAAAVMTAVAVRGFLSLYRTLILGRSKEVTEAGIGQVLAARWSMPLCHLPASDTAAVAGQMLDAVQARVADPDGPVDVLCLERGLTSSEGQGALHGDRRVSLFTQEPPVLVIRVDPTTRMTLPPAPEKVAGQLLRGIPWLVAGMAAVIAVAARSVAELESQECAPLPPDRRAIECAERPLTYGDALYWLLNRLSGGDPEGLGAHTGYARSLGLMVTLMSVIVVGGVITWLVQQAVARTQRFGQEVTDAYNETRPPLATPTPADERAARPAPWAPLGPSAPPPPPAILDPQTLTGFAAGLVLGVVLTIRRRR